MKDPFSLFDSDETREEKFGKEQKLHWKLTVVELEVEIWSKGTSSLVSSETIKINNIVAFNADYIVEEQLQHIINASTHTFLKDREDENEPDLEYKVVGAVIINIMHLGVMTPDDFTRQRVFGMGLMTVHRGGGKGETSH